MYYYMENKKIYIDETKKPFGKGSEGRVYRQQNQLYKIYEPSAIYEFGHNKLHCHQYLIGIPTKQINLPNAILFNEDGSYAGYRMDLIPGEQKANLRVGISQMPSPVFINNLKILEQDLTLLAKYQVVASDVQPVNYIYNQQAQQMHIIDPGRYAIHHDVTNQEQNLIQFKSLVNQLIYNDIVFYKPLKGKAKLQKLRDYIVAAKQDELDSAFFERELQDFETPHTYFKSLERFLH